MIRNSNDIADYISPLAFGMPVDKIADVRCTVIKAVRITFTYFLMIFYFNVLFN